MRGWLGAAFLAVVVAAATLAVLGYLSLRQWDASAELLFREQARDMASMAAEKAEMLLRQAEEDALDRIALALADGDFTPAGLDALRRASPLVRDVYPVDRRGRVLYPRPAFGDVRLHVRARQVFKDGHEVRLTRKEFELLRYLVEHPGEVITRDRLLDEVWGYEQFPTTRTVDPHMLRLRQKLERDPERPVHFLTVHGQGYRFVT